MNLFTLIADETAATIEGLTGITPEISLIDADFISIMSASELSGPFVKLNIVSFFNENSLPDNLFLLPPHFVSFVSDMMLGGDGLLNDELSEDEFDCSKEITDNIFGALSTTSFHQAQIPLKMMCHQGRKVDLLNGTNLSSELSFFYKLFSYKIKIKEFESYFYFLLNEDTFNALNSTPIPEKKEIKMNKQSLLDDVLVKVSVLVGSKMLSLEELQSINSNTTIELEQLANDPLKVFINNVPYAEGEVVIVDGMYGVQLTKIYDKEDVYHV